MTLWFYGDSWPNGCELENSQGKSRPELAFPAMVSYRLRRSFVNKAVTGSSQPYLIEAFLESDVESNDIAIFCLTAKTRRMYRSVDNSIVESQFNHDDRYVNEYEDERVSSQTCALLYFLAQQKNVKPYFFNLFDTVRHDNKLYQVIPDDCWLIPRNHSVLSWLFDPDFFTRNADHHNGDFREWLDRNCELVEKYIRPCEAHPNITGHRVIADYIVETLQKKSTQW